LPRIEKPVEEGEKSECIYCGQDLIARLTDYKGRFPDYLQWQLVTERKSHYLKDGGCKNQDKEESTSSTKVDSELPKTNSLDEDMRYVKNKVDLMFAMIKEQFQDYTDRKNHS